MWFGRARACFDSPNPLANSLDFAVVSSPLSPSSDAARVCGPGKTHHYSADKWPQAAISEAEEESRGEEKSEKVNDAEMRMNPVSQILTPIVSGLNIMTIVFAHDIHKSSKH